MGDRECPYCGRRLEPLTVEVGGSSFEVGARPCGCAAARAAGEARLEAEAKAEAARLRDGLLAAGIPRRFVDAEADGAPRIAADARAGRGCYIAGGVGAGKTHLACAVARLAAQSGTKVRFATAAGMLDEAKATFRRSAEDESEVLGRYERCGLLVLDDLGKEAPTEWALGRLFRVVNARYERMLPIVCTSQYRRSDLARRMGRGDPETAKAIASRLCEMCGTVELGGEDRRLS